MVVNSQVDPGSASGSWALGKRTDLAEGTRERHDQAGGEGGDGPAEN